MGLNSDVVDIFSKNASLTNYSQKKKKFGRKIPKTFSTRVGELDYVVLGNYTGHISTNFYLFANLKKNPYSGSLLHGLMT